MSAINNIDISCYENIIGLSRTACNCPQYDGNLFYNSLSDLFLDELEGIDLKQILGAESCEKGQIWDIMQNARDTAVRTWITDSNNELLKYNKLKRMPFKGLIGRAQWKNTWNFNKTYAGNRYICANTVSGKWLISGITTVFTATGTADVKIYNNLNELVTTVTLQTEGNKAKFNALNVQLPMHNGLVDNLQYYFVFQVDPNNLPKKLDYGCGTCSGVQWSFACSRPDFRTQSTKGNSWQQYVMCGDWQGNTLTDFEDVPCTQVCNCNAGLILHSEFTCDVSQVLCMDEVDFNNPLAMGMAFAIRYKAGEYLYKTLLGSTNINRYTMMSGEQMGAFINLYIEKYNEYKNYVVNNAVINTNDCLTCKDFTDIIKVGIQA